MARGNFGSASNYFSDTTPLTSYPISVSAWVYITDVAGGVSDYVWTLTELPTGDWLTLIVTATGQARVDSVNFSVNSGSATTATGLITNNTWTHVGAVFTSSSSRSVYAAGSKATDSTNVLVDMASMDEMFFGMFRPSSGWLGDGYLADMGVWNAALDDDEMKALSKGFACHLVRPSSLVHYIPGVRNNVTPRGDMAVSGAVGVLPHPPIIGSIAT